jgi:hypothetical protein
MDIGNLLMRMICADVVKSAPSPSSGILLQSRKGFFLPGLLTLSPIAAILNVFMNKHVTLAGLFVL